MCVCVEKGPLKTGAFFCYAFREDLQRWEVRRKVVYVTSIERISREEGLEQGLEQGREEGLEQGREEGLEQGRDEGVRASILRVLKVRWGSPAPEVEARLGEIHGSERLSQLLEGVVGAESFESWWATV